MYLSQLTLNPRRRDVMLALSNVYDLHRTLATRCFDESSNDAQRNSPRADAAQTGAHGLLFRLDIDRQTDLPIVLMQSRLRPNLQGLPAGYVLRVDEPKLFNLAGRLAKGQRYQFRLRANPTRREGNGGRQARLNGGADGVRKPVYGQDEQLAWLLRKAEQSGFQIPFQVDGDDLLYEVDVYDEGHQCRTSSSHDDSSPTKQSKWVSVVFNGVLEVTDPQKLLNAIESGIGTAKGMGFGLLSLAPFSQYAGAA